MITIDGQEVEFGLGLGFQFDQGTQTMRIQDILTEGEPRKILNPATREEQIHLPFIHDEMEFREYLLTFAHILNRSMVTFQDAPSPYMYRFI